MMLFLLALATVQFASAELPPLQIDGRCTYPPGLGEPGPGEVRILCNRVELEPDAITFESRDWGPQISFLGRFEGNQLEVEAVQLRTGEPVAVRGRCQVYRASGEVSVIACTSVEKHGSRSWIANFVPWRG